MIDVGLRSTDRIAEFFGIAPAMPKQRSPRATPSAPPRSQTTSLGLQEVPAAQRSQPPAQGVQKVIEDALKAAGLMK